MSEASGEPNTQPAATEAQQPTASAQPSSSSNRSGGGGGGGMAINAGLIVAIVGAFFAFSGLLITLSSLASANSSLGVIEIFAVVAPVALVGLGHLDTFPQSSQAAKLGGVILAFACSIWALFSTITAGKTAQSDSGRAVAAGQFFVFLGEAITVASAFF